MQNHSEITCQVWLVGAPCWPHRSIKGYINQLLVHRLLSFYPVSLGHLLTFVYIRIFLLLLKSLCFCFSHARLLPQIRRFRGLYEVTDRFPSRVLPSEWNPGCLVLLLDSDPRFEVASLFVIACEPNTPRKFSASLSQSISKVGLFGPRIDFSVYDPSRTDISTPQVSIPIGSGYSLLEQIHYTPKGLVWISSFEQTDSQPITATRHRCPKSKISRLVRILTSQGHRSCSDLSNW